MTPFIRKTGAVEWRTDPPAGAERVWSEEAAEPVDIGKPVGKVGRRPVQVHFFQVHFRNDVKTLRAFVEAGAEQSTAMMAGAELLKRGHGERVPG